MTIADAAERSRALDVSNSFCVTAPAGSGKTELLIQRFLALLSRVQKPEQVLAITFTRKAAAEMRERVLQALQDAANGVPCEGEHQQVTRVLASAALAWGDQHGWYLTRDISRLNIKTIDSFCAGLTRQMPVLSQFGGQARALDDATALYREAVDELFALAGSGRPEADDIAELILHFDNNWDRLRELLVTMLARRDQWHEYLGRHGSPQEAEEHLHATVAAVVEEVLGELAPLLDPYQDEILDLLCYSLGNQSLPLPPDFPAPVSAQAASWRQIRDLFLTQAGSWRKSVNVGNGFPPGKGEGDDRKAHFKDLVQRLAQVPGLEAELHSLAWLPDMSENSASWQVVVHLSHVLPLLSACLLLVFQRRGVVDHTQVALSALQALGEDEAPTELALRLDYVIEHILVDEFQDTAINQYRLVGRLTRGWGQHNALNPDAPRTVFIVGDGMQSIYGFRDANVGLFLKARREGFNGVIPEGLALRCNFRSEEGLVQWVNETFRAAFPGEENIRRGRVRYTDAVAVRPAAAEPAVAMHAFCGEGALQQEAEWMVQQISAALASDGVNSIAVLGRSRNQLAPVIAELQARGIPYAAQEMDRLAGSPLIVDLLSLCRALANPADRVAWYALLRAPWCGLQLADLQRVAAAMEGGRFGNLAGLLAQSGLPAGLSQDGRSRLAHLGDCLAWAERKRDRLALRVWLEQLWLLLGGAATASGEQQLQDAQLFFQLLQRAEQEGVGLDVDWLQQQLERLFASGENPGARLQLMTLHKAKGLEFDWVFIPALASPTRGDSRDILLWDEYNSPAGERGFLLAADDHGDDKSASLYNFLKHQRREKSRLELTRLLYVGATRAVRQLVLSASLQAVQREDESLPPAYRPPSEGALLAPIWGVFEHQMVLHPEQDATETFEATGGPLLTRLRRLPGLVTAVEPVAVEDSNIPERSLNQLDRLVGTVIHQALEELSLLPRLPTAIEEAQVQHWRHALQALGLHGDKMERAWERVHAAVVRTLGDESGGRWLLSAAHGDAHSELPLSIARDGAAEDIVIDRTFIDNETGIRWIVDYKSSAPADGESEEQFAEREAAAYSPQLQRYRDAMREYGPEPVRCALYFTSLSRLQPLPELDYDP